MPSQIPSSMPGMDGRFREMAGMASEYLGRNGSDICLIWSDVNLYVEEKTEEESRGKKEAAARVGNIAPAMLPVFSRDVRCLQGTGGRCGRSLRPYRLVPCTPVQSAEIGVGAAGARQSNVVNRGAAGVQNVVLSRCLVRPSSRKIASATLPCTSCFPSSKTARGGASGSSGHLSIMQSSSLGR